MAAPSVLQHLVLLKAVRVCGSGEGLSRVLSVPAFQLRRWIEGEDRAPLVVLNRAMRLVNDAYRRS